MFDSFLSLVKPTYNNIIAEVLNIFYAATEKILAEVNKYFEISNGFKEIEQKIQEARDECDTFGMKYLAFVHEYDVSGHLPITTNKEDKMTTKNTATKRTNAAKKAWVTRRAMAATAKRSAASKKAWATRRKASHA
jgi:hypothetical protein